MRRVTLKLFIIALLALPASAVRSADPATEFAEALQHRYDAVRDFSTDFVHIYEGGLLKKKLTESGDLLIKKPGKMRWRYKSPEEKLFVSDGLKIYSYIPADKQVIVSSVPADDSATTPALFLAGKGNLTRDFTVSSVSSPAGMPPGSKSLKLVPKKPQQDYDWLVLSADPVSLRLQGLYAMDGQGGTSTFIFMNLQENVGAADKTFDFKMPRGVDVVNDSSIR